MFENDWILQQLAQERQRDMLRQLQYDQLVRQARSLPGARGHMLYHVLDQVGQHLIQWGEWLRARHAAYHSSLSTTQEISHG